MLKDNPKTLFVFGDNLMERGLGGQAKEMRGEPNAVGIPTKRAPSMAVSAFFHNGDFDTFVATVAPIFMRLFKYTIAGGEVVWPRDGVGTGLAALQDRAPKLWLFLEDNRKLLEKLGEPYQ